MIQKNRSQSNTLPFEDLTVVLILPDGSLNTLEVFCTDFVSDE